MGASSNAGGYGTRVELPPVFRGGISLSKHGTRERRNSLRRNLIIATRYKGARGPSREQRNRDEGRGDKSGGRGPKNAWKGIKSVRETSVVGGRGGENSVELNF